MELISARLIYMRWQMRIKVDNREKENSHILEYFNSIGLTMVDKTKAKDVRNLENVYIINDLCSIGDYCNLDKPNVFVERKAHWNEFAGNCGRNHARFKRELERLDECGGRMIILIETMQPLSTWKNNRMKITSSVMQKIMDAWKQKHNIDFIQCKREDAGAIIHQILIEGGKP